MCDRPFQSEHAHPTPSPTHNNMLSCKCHFTTCVNIQTHTSPMCRVSIVVLWHKQVIGSTVISHRWVIWSMVVSLVDTIGMVAAARTQPTPALTGHVLSSQYAFPFSDLEMQLSLIFPHIIGSNQRTLGHRIKLDRACHNAHGHLVPD